MWRVWISHESMKRTFGWRKKTSAKHIVIVKKSLEMFCVLFEKKGNIKKCTYDGLFPDPLLTCCVCASVYTLHTGLL